MNLKAEGFGLIQIENLIGLSRNDSQLIFIKRDTKRFLDCFKMTWNDLTTDSGMARNKSDSLGMDFNPIFSPGYFQTTMRKLFLLRSNFRG